MANQQTLERRVAALEARVGEDIEAGFGETLYRMHRAIIKQDLRMAKVLEADRIPDVSDEEIDEALDES